jgi:hypothetical protein
MILPHVYVKIFLAVKEQYQQAHGYMFIQVMVTSYNLPAHYLTKW